MSFIRKRFAVVLFVLLCLVAIGVRIWLVNAGYQGVPVTYYSMGEWLSVDDDYYVDETEPSEGYSFRIDSVEVMSPNEYLQRYGTDGVTSLDTFDADDPCVVVLDMTIRNDSSEQGGVDSFQWQVVPQEQNTSYAMDYELSGHVEKAMSEGQFSIKPGGEYRTHIAFSGQEDLPYLQDATGQRRPIITARSFRLALTMRPHRKVFEFEL